MSNNANIDVVIKNKETTVYKDRVAAVSSVNDRGVFDILPEHENFISLIKDKIIIHPTLRENKEVPIQNGIMRVYKDQVQIYVDLLEEKPPAPNSKPNPQTNTNPA
jgi:F0F1-type ATP synthase epsilon subunit